MGYNSVADVLQLILCDVAKHYRAEMHIKTISSIFSDISMHQKCQTGWIHDLASYFWARIKFSPVPGFCDLL